MAQAPKSQFPEQFQELSILWTNFTLNNSSKPHNNFPRSWVVLSLRSQPVTDLSKPSIGQELLSGFYLKAANHWVVILIHKVHKQHFHKTDIFNQSNHPTPTLVPKQKPASSNPGNYLSKWYIFTKIAYLQFPLWTTCDMNTIVNLRGTLEQKGDCPKEKFVLSS